MSIPGFPSLLVPDLDLRVELPSVMVRLVPSPFADGLTRLDIPGGVTTYCTAKTNSQGCAPRSKPSFSSAMRQ